MVQSAHRSQARKSATKQTRARPSEAKASVEQTFKASGVEALGPSLSVPDAAARPALRSLASPQEAVGQIVGLMLQSPTHKHLFLTDLEWLVLPPVMLQQFRIIHRNGRPIAYASWARLSDEAAGRLKSGVRKLKPEDWNAEGGELWLIDLLAPFGGQEAVLKELKEKVFEGKPMKTLQPAPDGSGVAVVEW